jgi:KaiC/GvpD/RAD55 family RecA-like ATPase
VVIDAVSDLEQAAMDVVRYRDFLYSLTQALASRFVTTMLMAETGGVIGSSAASSEVSYMSDNILLLEMLYGDDLTRTVRILKTRGSKHEGRRLDLRISEDGIEVG